MNRITSNYKVSHVQLIICFSKHHKRWLHCATSYLQSKCWIKHSSDKLLSAAISESSFSDTLGHINTRKVLLSCLATAGLTQEEDEGDKAHKQYSSSCLLPACLPSREIWLQLRREQLGVSWKSRSTVERCQTSGVTGLMEEEEKLSDKVGRDRGLSLAVQ